MSNPVYPLADILPMNEVTPLKVRSGCVLAKKLTSRKILSPMYLFWIVKPIFISSTNLISYLLLLLALINTSTSPNQGFYVIEWDVSVELSSLFVRHILFLTKQMVLEQY